MNRRIASLSAHGVEEIYSTNKEMEGLQIKTPPEKPIFGDETPMSEKITSPRKVEIKEGIVTDRHGSNVRVPNLTAKALERGWKTGGKTRKNKTTGGSIVTHLLTIRNQVKLYHWQTKQFSRHKATDDLTATLDANIDAFVESYMGRYGRPSVSGSIKLHNFSDSAAKSFVAKETKYLENELPRKIGKKDSDLLNIRDEILADLNKVLYLFTLQ